MKKSYLTFVILLTGLFCSSGCLWILPDGDVPPNLVGDQNTKTENVLLLKDAEAAMSGAIVRALIRNGHSAEQVPMAFHMTSTKQNVSFIRLLRSTGMISIVKQGIALYLIDSHQRDGVWELRLMKKNGSVVMKKTVKYRPAL